MNFLKENILALFLLLLLIIIGIDRNLLDKVNDELKEEKWQLVQENENLKGQIKEAHLYNKFTDALAKVGSIPWSEGNNCYDHSKALQQELLQDGIESTIMINEDRSHAWLAVWIEANTGNFIEPKKYKPFELRDNKLEVICSNN